MTSYEVQHNRIMRRANNAGGEDIGKVPGVATYANETMKQMNMILMILKRLYSLRKGGDSRLSLRIVPLVLSLIHI